MVHSCGLGLVILCINFHCFLINQGMKKYCYFLKKILFTTVLSQWDFSHGKFGLWSSRKASCDRVMLPNLWCMLGIWVFHNPLNSDMDYGMFNVLTDGSACHCTRRCMEAVRESALCTPVRIWVFLPELTLEEKSISAPGNWSCISCKPVGCRTNWAPFPPVKVKAIFDITNHVERFCCTRWIVFNTSPVKQLSHCEHLVFGFQLWYNPLGLTGWCSALV